MRVQNQTRTAIGSMFFFLVALAIPICCGQIDPIDVHVTPRVVAKSSNGEPDWGVSKNKSLRVDTDLVLVPVMVTDQMDRIVMGLEKNNFAVYDGADQQVIRHLSAEDAPISLGVIFDTSSSMYGKIERARQAIVQFLRSANPEDEFFLIEFASRPEVVVDFTSSVDEIQGQISKATPDGGTALLDALYFGLDRMKRAHNQRRALLIVSDGAENRSRYTLKEVWPVVEEAGVQIYAMGIFDEAPRTKAEREGPNLLSSVTNVTGGRTFPVRTLKKIGDAANELALELRNQYLIAYKPNALAHDGKWHKINVRVRAPQNSSRLRVYAKRGYYAPAE